MLRLVTSTTRDFYARDRNKMIRTACGLLGTEYVRPADALFDIAKIIQFKVVCQPIAGPARALTLLRLRTIVVCSNLRSKLDFPVAPEAVATFALAQEIAHARLHFFSGYPVPGPQQVEEARAYAGVFLVPRHQLYEQKAYYQLIDAGRQNMDMWPHVASLANFFGVSQACVIRTLEELGVVVLDRESRVLKLAA